MSVRARRRTPQPERGRSDGKSSTRVRVRTGGTMGVARTPRRYTAPPQGHGQDRSSLFLA